MSPLHDPHPTEVRERAYELWAHIYSQNAAAVADHLRQGREEDLGPVEIADSTVRAWSNRDGWTARFEGDMKRLAPGIFSSVSANIMQGSYEAIQFHRDLVAGRLDGENPKLLAVKQRAADSLLDRSGHLAWTRKTTEERPVGPQEDHSHSLADLSIDELRSIAYGGMTAAEVRARRAARVAANTGAAPTIVPLAPGMPRPSRG